MSSQATAAARDLRQVFGGPVHLPGTPGYHEQRAALDLPAPEPVLVAEAADAADVRAAVGWARRHGVPFAVQATGHGTVVASDGGLLLKTSRLAGVLVDPGRRVARVEAGVRWGAVLAQAARFGLAPLSGSSTDVGVVGYTLGGGIGWLARRFGFAADSVLRADVVTADGDQLTAAPGRHEDLFWAIRGGGGNFGVVTALEFRLYPVHTVVAGTVSFPFERAADLLAAYREWAPPPELTTTVILTRTAAAGPQLALHGVHSGDPAAARGALAPLWKAVGAPLSDRFTETTFAELNLPSLYPATFELLDALPDPAITAIVDAVTDRVPTPAGAVEVRRWGGAMAGGAAPVGHRDVPFSVTMEGPSQAAAPVRRFATGGSFLNFTKDPARTRTAYTAADHQRLRDVKRSYDPENVFHRNCNIEPAGPAGSGADR
jgi:FAD/FMN-containing dehydrogenase